MITYYKYLSIYNSNFPKLLCLPKIHKLLTQQHILCQNTANILKHSLEYETNYTIEEILSLVNAINNYNLPFVNQKLTRKMGSLSKIHIFVLTINFIARFF